uniref:DUF892 family protein n=1 Tax=Roseihalotalea indica TaxID=2867963 RepID=A0AA49JER9_9BACT|nr:DUF892 family protein [Tunicatimonas sp. TK19036]
MSSVSITYELAVHQIQQLYSTEKQCLMYLKVLAYKLTNLYWKDVLWELLPLTHQKIKQLHRLQTIVQGASETVNTAGINGIVSEGFEQMKSVENSELKDALIVHTLILLNHYKLGSYRILLTYFQFLRRENEANIVQTILAQEEGTLSKLMRILSSSIPTSSPISEAFVTEIHDATPFS